LTERPTGSPRRDRVLVWVTRTTRGFGAGALSIVLALDLARSGYTPFAVGILLGLALGAGAGWSLLAPRLERQWSRRATFVVSAGALAMGGFLLWAAPGEPVAVLVALLLGGIVAGTADVSPLGALEQATLADATSETDRTSSYVVYNLLGYAGGAVGALVAGPLSAVAFGPPPGALVGFHDPTLFVYGLLGLGLVPAYLALSRPPDRVATGPAAPLSPQARPIVHALSTLFAVDAFGGGLIVNSLVVYYFAVRYAPPVAVLGALFFASNLAAAASLVLALPLARRFGLVNTMVFTHLPSSVVLVLIAFAPSFTLAGALWVGRAVLSQMDVPTRQSYTQAIVPPDDRAAAAGYTTAARSGQALGGPVAGAFLAAGGPWLAAPFAVAGSVKIGYDLALYRRFRHLRPPEESAGAGGRSEPPS